MAEAIVETKQLGKDEILDELMKDDSIDKEDESIDLSKKVDEEDKSRDESVKKIADEEEKEIKEAEEIEKEIEIKDDDYADIPKRQQILKEFPELFKKFPAIEHAIYREQQYAEVFPTINDAKEALARNQDFKSFENELFSGDLRLEK